MKRLEGETTALKEEVAQLHADLSSERDKLDDVMAAYSRENEEALNEFVALRQEKGDLMAERDALLGKVGRYLLQDMLYRATHQVVHNLPLTTKQKLR